MKLLLAEDTRDLSRALCAVLTHEGYDVDPVYDGKRHRNILHRTATMLLSSIS